jgi:hypothetical protein
LNGRNESLQLLATRSFLCWRPRTTLTVKPLASSAERAWAPVDLPILSMSAAMRAEHPIGVSVPRFRAMLNRSMSNERSTVESSRNAPNGTTSSQKKSFHFWGKGLFRFLLDGRFRWMTLALDRVLVGPPGSQKSSGCYFSTTARRADFDSLDTLFSPKSLENACFSEARTVCRVAD